MIRYNLHCDNDHSFESWFQSADAYETLEKANMVNCPVCGSSTITKMLMAPAVQKTAMAVTPIETGQEHPLEKMRKDVEANADYVGKDFAKTARAMHDGDAPDRAIYGEANARETKRLVEDGVPVLPLPFIPRKRTN